MTINYQTYFMTCININYYVIYFKTEITFVRMIQWVYTTKKKYMLYTIQHVLKTYIIYLYYT